MITFLRVGQCLSMWGCHPVRMRKCCLYPTDLSDAQWELLEPMLPKAKKRGRPPSDRRLILNGLLYFVRLGCAWRLLPREFAPWETYSKSGPVQSPSAPWSSIRSKMTGRITSYGAECPLEIPHVQLPILQSDTAGDLHSLNPFPLSCISSSASSKFKYSTLPFVVFAG